MPNDTSAPDIGHARAWLLDAAQKLADFAHDEDVEARKQEMLDVRATLVDVANRAPLPVPKGAVVVMTEQALDAYHEATRLIADAQRWATGHDLAVPPEALEEATKIVADRREKVVEMELSLHRSLAHLMTVAQDHDGPVAVTRDSPASFYWRHVQSGYHGGIVFHANHVAGQREPAGTWSIHT